MKLSNIKRLLRDDMPDLPAGEWADLWLQVQNQSNEQLTQALQNALTIGDNFNAALGVFRFTHGVARTIPVPDGMKGRPVGIDCWRCIQVPGTTRPVFAYLDWQHVDNDDPKAKNQVTITPYFAGSGTGRAGETISSFASGVTLPIAGTVTNITSIPLTVGSWLVSCLGVATTGGTAITGAEIGISTTSGTLTGSNGDRYQELGSGAAGVVRVSTAIPSLPLTLSAAQSVYLVGAVGTSAITTLASGRITAVRTIDEPTVSPPQADLLLFFSGG